MHMCLLQAMTQASSVPRSVLGVNGCLTVGTWGDSCECPLCHIAHEHGGMHATHIYVTGMLEDFGGHTEVTFYPQSTILL